MISTFSMNQEKNAWYITISLHWDFINDPDFIAAHVYEDPLIQRGGVFVDPNDSTFSWEEPEGFISFLNLDTLSMMYNLSDPSAQRKADLWSSIMIQRISPVLTNLNTQGLRLPTVQRPQLPTEQN